MLLIIRKLDLIEKKEFAITRFDLNYKDFILYIAALNISSNIVIKVHL